MLADHGVLVVSQHGASFTLTHGASRRWGAYATPGVEADDLGEFRRALRRALAAEATVVGHPIEVYASREGVHDWTVDVIWGAE